MEESQNNLKVVIFDSGIGGLNVLKSCLQKYPALHCIYAADNARVPYGNRSREEVFALTSRVLDGAMSHSPAAIVVACNTVTAECITVLRRRYPVPVVGMQPAVKPAARVGGRCLVLATKATASSDNFKKLVNDNFPSATVFASSKLAEYVEKNIYNLPQTLPEELLPTGYFDSLVLGCTHYIFVSQQLKKRYLCRIFDGVDGTVTRLGKILGIADHQAGFSGISDHCEDIIGRVCFFNGDIDRNRQVLMSILGKNSD